MNLKIMPLGDSITRGKGGSTWRLFLKDLLDRCGIDCRFVGSCPHAPNYSEPWGDAYRALEEALGNNIEHEGWGGLKISDIIELKDNPAHPDYPDFTIEELLLQNRADIILLMIGTNDILNQYKLDRAPERLDNLIGRITTHSNAHLLVSTIPPNYAGQEKDLNADVKLFNSQIPAIVNNRQSSGFKVSTVDAGSKLSREDMLQDGLHPNIYGNQKIAAAWFDAIVESIRDTE
ncbi:MAG: hypothetical protein JRH12_26770 [Deltaproteobacteria bacterium]|jgi:hypothetical protein|nr:hypothetical protein [Deltaproteobacteria bacterium]MBW2479195.1 hypothetical protein [Deltaproteobacteria bacterium]